MSLLSFILFDGNLTKQQTANTTLERSITYSTMPFMVISSTYFFLVRFIAHMYDQQLHCVLSRLHATIIPFFITKLCVREEWKEIVVIFHFLSSSSNF